MANFNHNKMAARALVFSAGSFLGNDPAWKRERARELDILNFRLWHMTMNMKYDGKGNPRYIAW